MNLPIRFGAGGAWLAASAGPCFPGGKGIGSLGASPSPRRAREGAAGRRNRASARGATTRLFRGILTSPTRGGKGLGEREEAAGEGAGGRGSGAGRRLCVRHLAVGARAAGQVPGPLSARGVGEAVRPAGGPGQRPSFRTLPSPRARRRRLPPPWSLFFHFEIGSSSWLPKRLISEGRGPAIDSISTSD